MEEVCIEDAKRVRMQLRGIISKASTLRTDHKDSYSSEWWAETDKLRRKAWMALLSLRQGDISAEKAVAAAQDLAQRIGH